MDRDQNKPGLDWSVLCQDPYLDPYLYLNLYQRLDPDPGPARIRSCKLAQIEACLYYILNILLYALRYDCGIRYSVPWVCNPWTRHRPKFYSGSMQRTRAGPKLTTAPDIGQGPFFIFYYFIFFSNSGP